MVSHGEVRWCYFPVPDKRRPVLVLTRDAVVRRLTSITVAPITTTLRDLDSRVFVGPEDGLPQPSVVNLDAIQTFSSQLVGDFVTRLSPERMREVYAAIQFALGFDGLED
jgi:mRNA interferase MazF